jgi:hypothetical protein
MAKFKSSKHNPFPKEIIEAINSLVTKHLAPEESDVKYFDFITDLSLAKRLSEEFRGARYIYKFLSGMDATDWLLRAQVRIQVLMYASIYEAALHHILFEDLKDTEEVTALLTQLTTKEKALAEPTRKALSKYLIHEGKECRLVYSTKQKRDISKIRFDEKATTALSLGILDKDLAKELIELYEVRNAIHIHAELKKGIQYEIDIAKLAYRRMTKFKLMATEELNRRKTK